MKVKMLILGLIMVGTIAGWFLFQSQLTQQAYDNFLNSRSELFKKGEYL